MVMDSRLILILLQGLNLALSATENVTPTHEEIGNSTRNSRIPNSLGLGLTIEFKIGFNGFVTFQTFLGLGSTSL